jgi:hypothetical protein
MTVPCLECGTLTKGSRCCIATQDGMPNEARRPSVATAPASAEREPGWHPGSFLIGNPRFAGKVEAAGIDPRSQAVLRSERPSRTNLLAVAPMTSGAATSVLTRWHLRLARHEQAGASRAQSGVRREVWLGTSPSGFGGAEVGSMRKSR